MISFSFTNVQPVLLYIDVDITYYVTFNNHPSRRCGQPTELYWLLLLLSRPVAVALSFVRIVKLWNNMCNVALPRSFTYVP